MKRYTRHRVPMLNRHGLKAANLLVDCRYVTRQELLDLLYSPNPKLTDSTPSAPNLPPPKKERLSVSSRWVE